MKTNRLNRKIVKQIDDILIEKQIDRQIDK